MSDKVQLRAAVSDEKLRVSGVNYLKPELELQYKRTNIVSAVIYLNT